jgi:hypothetical protein
MDNSIVQRYLNASSEALKTEWDGLVRLALELPTEAEGGGGKAIQEAATALAFASRCGTDSIKRKLLAIQHARAAGLAPEEIMAQGQEVTLSGHQASRRAEQIDQKVVLKWNVTGLTRQIIQFEYERICEVLDFNTADLFFTWLHAQLVDLKPEELKHMAGELAGPASRKPSRGPTGQRKAGRASAASQPQSTGTGAQNPSDQDDAGADTADDTPL